MKTLVVFTLTIATLATCIHFQNEALARKRVRFKQDNSAAITRCCEGDQAACGLVDALADQIFEANEARPDKDLYINLCADVPARN